MAAAKRTKAQREADLEEVAALYGRGSKLHEIAAHLNARRPYSLSVPTVCRDVREVVARWRESAASSIDERKAVELARLDELERTAWRDYEGSKRDRVRRTRETRHGAEVGETILTEDRIGNPQFLRIVESAINQRCKILGIEDAALIERLERIEEAGK